MDYTAFLAHFGSIVTDMRDRWEFFYPIEYATFTTCEDGKIFAGSKYIAEMPEDFDFEILWRDTEATVWSDAQFESWCISRDSINNYNYDGQYVIGTWNNCSQEKKKLQIWL